MNQVKQMKLLKPLLLACMLAASGAYAAGGVDASVPAKMGMPGNSPASKTVELDSLNKQQALDAMRKAPDDTVFVFQGQRKTKAQLLSEGASRKALAAPKVNSPFEAEHAKVEREEDAKVQAANALALAEFAALKQRAAQAK